MENKRLQDLTEAGIPQKVIDVLNGGPVTGDLTPGELFVLSKEMPEDRHKELIYIDSMPFEGIIELLNAIYISDKDAEYLSKRLKEIAVGFDQKATAVNYGDDFDAASYADLFNCIETIDHCVMMLTDTSTQAQIDEIVVKIKTFNPKIDDWVNVIENSVPSSDPSYAILLVALEEIEAIARKSKKLEDWLKLYEWSIEKSSYEKIALMEITSFTESFATWKNIHKIYVDKTKKLALQKMRELKGSFQDWKDIFEEYETTKCANHLSYQICCDMMMETGNVEELDILHSGVRDNHKPFALRVLHKIMIMLDTPKE